MNKAVQREGTARSAALLGEAALVDPAAFRAALAGVPEAVHVVASDGPAGLCGFTATAFAAVSDDPPTVLVAVNRASAQNAVFKANGVFSVNLLGSDASALGDVFAGRTGLKMRERFAHGGWSAGATGAPLLAEALVQLDCRISEIAEVATHSVIFGEVVAAHRAGEGAARALLYGDRSYL